MTQSPIHPDNAEERVPSAPIRGGRESGSAYWRSLDHVADTDEFREYMHREFPKGASELMSDDRRTFLKVMGASFALAGIGLGGCRRWPVEEIAPYANRPEGRIPGEAVKYATAWDFAGRGVPLLAESMDGRPIKLEGHEAYAGGGSDSFAQATLLDLYDIDRSRQVKLNGESSSWEDFETFCRTELSQVPSEKIAVVAPPKSGRTFARAKADFLEKYPKAHWVNFEPVVLDNLVEATQATFGAPMRPDHDWSKASCVLVLDGDPLGADPDATCVSRGWAQRRDPDHPDGMSRVYSFESILTLTGANVDERCDVPPAEMPRVAAAIEAALDGKDWAGEFSEKVTRAIEHVVEDLKSSGSKGLVVAGIDASPEVQSSAYRMNSKLGSIGVCAFWRPLKNPPLASSMAALMDQDLEAVIVLGGNPVYEFEGFADFYREVKHRIHLGLHEDETGVASSWHLCAAHWLEAWDDVENSDESVSLSQPLIQPLFGGRNAIEVLSMLTGEFKPAKSQVEKSFDGTTTQWRTALHDGFISGTRKDPVAPAAQSTPPRSQEISQDQGWSLRFAPSATMWDGRFANNGWMQELPDPITTLTWDNAVLMSPSSARELDVEDGDLISIEVAGKAVTAAVLRAPGIAHRVLHLPLGGGREFGGRICAGAGFRFESLRDFRTPWFRGGAKVEKASGNYPLATTQDHHAIDVDTRGHMGIAERLPTIFREADINEYKKDPGFAKHRTHVVHRLSQWEENTLQYGRYKWAMAIDLSKCTGCGACIVACQAENNIPVVGKDQVLRGREMHWLRLDRYYAFKENEDGSFDGDSLEKVAIQPVTCMQCENAPCEQVCPVAATVHDEEGLNAMVYNRCIGTRYCSNNCPYKVRRFNYFDYHNREPMREGTILKVQPDYYQPGKQATPDDLKRLLLNPDVTVRMRGVMEKCNYCQQRIASARIKAKNAWAKSGGRTGGGQRELANGDATIPIPDDSIDCACAQVCSTDAIVFGDLNDPQSRVAKLFKNDRTYQMLEELHVEARTQYLAKVRNPHGGGSEGEGHHGHGGHGHGDHGHGDHGHGDHGHGDHGHDDHGHDGINHHESHSGEHSSHE